VGHGTRDWVWLIPPRCGGIFGGFTYFEDLSPSFIGYILPKLFLAPGWEPALRRIEKRVQAFIWKKGIPKVAKATLRLPKNEGGLAVWSLVEKAKAFTTMWVEKSIQNLTNPILEATIQAATRHYAEVRDTQVPLWESCLDHSHDIVATNGLKLLAMMQGAWSVVVRRHPTIEKGNWVAYYDGSTTKQALKDVMWAGRGKVLEAGPDPKDSVTTEWYSPDPDTGVHTHEPLPNEEALGQKILLPGR
jgi:hypothetical protein